MAEEYHDGACYASGMGALRIAVVGHVEHVTLGSADHVPEAGDIVHLRDARFIPGGGGALAFAQLCKSDAEIHFFTALGRDDGGRAVAERIRGESGRVHVHAARRNLDHPRVVVLIDAQGRRTIVVTGAPLQPEAGDPLPWSTLADCAAVYFTGSDPASLRAARAARVLCVTARRSATLREAAVAPDVIVGSASDPRESAPFDAYDPRPAALVLTDGPRAIRVIRAGRETLVETPPSPAKIAGDYGAGDSFAGALTFFLAHGLSVEEACRRAGPYGAAVLRGMDPIEAQAPLVAP
jgi:ribokinase